MDLKKVMIGIIILFIIFSFWKFYFDQDTAVDNDPKDNDPIVKMIEKTNSDNIKENIEYLQDHDTRYIGTEGNHESAGWIKDKFDSYGLDTYYHNFTYEGMTLSNVIGIHEGTDTEEKKDTYILSAHLDSKNKKDINLSAPGADDDASGIAAILESARVLSGYDFEKTMMFCAWNAEEVGLIGSRAFTEDIEGRYIKGVYQFDMVGYAPKGHKISVNANLHSKNLVDLMVDTNKKYDISLNITPVTQDPETRSDHSSFWMKDYKASLIIEKIYNPYYHTEEDTIDKISISMVSKVTRLALSSTARLAEVSHSSLSTLSLEIVSDLDHIDVFYLSRKEITPIGSKHEELFFLLISRDEIN